MCQPDGQAGVRTTSYPLRVIDTTPDCYLRPPAPYEQTQPPEAEQGHGGGPGAASQFGSPITQTSITVTIPSTSSAEVGQAGSLSHERNERYCGKSVDLPVQASWEVAGALPLGAESRILKIEWADWSHYLANGSRLFVRAAVEGQYSATIGIDGDSFASPQDPDMGLFGFTVGAGFMQ